MFGIQRNNLNLLRICLLIAASFSLQVFADDYVIPSDFTPQDNIHPHPSHHFWSYKNYTPDPFYRFHKAPLNFDFKEKINIPVVLGNGKEVQQLNYGRTQFYQENFRQASRSWLQVAESTDTSNAIKAKACLFIGTAYLNIIEDNDYKNRHQLAQLADIATAAQYIQCGIKGITTSKDTWLKTNKGFYFLSLAKIYYWGGEFTRSRMMLDQAKNAAIKDPEVYDPKILYSIDLLQAKIFGLNHDYLESVQILDSMIRNKDYVDQKYQLYHEVASIFSKLSNFRVAEEFYRLSIDSVPLNQFADIKGSSEIYYDYGESLFWQGKYSDAILAYEKSIQSLASNHHIIHRALLRLADSNLAMNKRQQSKELYFEAHQSTALTVGSPFHAIAKLRLYCDSASLTPKTNKFYEKTKLKYKQINPNISQLATNCLELSIFDQNPKAQINTSDIKLFRLAKKKRRSMVKKQLTQALKINQYALALELFIKNEALLKDQLSAENIFILYVNKEKTNKQNALDFDKYLIELDPIDQIIYQLAQKPAGDLETHEFSSDLISYLEDKLKNNLKKQNEPLNSYQVQALASLPIDSFTNDQWTTLDSFSTSSSWRCEMTTKLVQNKILDAGEIIQKVESWLTSSAPTLAKKNLPCLEFYTDLEFHSSLNLNKIYSKRSTWLATPSLRGLFELAADHLLISGKDHEAMSLYSQILPYLNKTKTKTIALSKITRANKISTSH